MSLKSVESRSPPPRFAGVVAGFQLGSNRTCTCAFGVTLAQFSARWRSPALLCCEPVWQTLHEYPLFDTVAWVLGRPTCSSCTAESRCWFAGVVPDSPGKVWHPLHCSGMKPSAVAMFAS